MTSAGSSGEDDRTEAERAVSTGGGIAGRSRARVGLLRRMVAGSYALAQPVARSLLPLAARQRLAGLARFFERVGTPSVAASFEARSIPLAKLAPVLPPDRFDGRVLLVNNALAWGGVERQIIYSLKGLQDRLGGEHTGLLCIHLGTDANYDFYRSALGDYSGLVRNVMALPDAWNALRRLVDASRLAEIEGCISWLPREPRDEVIRFLADFVTLRPAVVHVWQDALSISAGIAAKIAGVPRIIVAGRNVAPINFAYYRPYMQFGYQELAACADLTMLNNSVAGATSYAQWLGLQEDRFTILRNGIDVETIARPNADDIAVLQGKVGIPQHAPIVGSIFRFYDEKRPFLWIETAAIIAQQRPDAHFVVFGTGPLQDAMLRLARRKGIADRFHLPGTISAPEQALGMMDVFLLTSQFEGTPNVVLEAGLLGVPVVATDAGGTAETIEPGVTGFVAKSAEAAELAAQVIAILSDGGFREAARTSAPAFILNRFGLQRMIDETVTLYGVA